MRIILEITKYSFTVSNRNLINVPMQIKRKCTVSHIPGFEYVINKSSFHYSNHSITTLQIPYSNISIIDIDISIGHMLLSVVLKRLAKKKTGMCNRLSKFSIVSIFI